MIYFQYTAEQEGSTWLDTALVLTSAFFSLLAMLKILYVVIFLEEPEVEISCSQGLHETTKIQFALMFCISDFV